MTRRFAGIALMVLLPAVAMAQSSASASSAVSLLDGDERGAVERSLPTVRELLAQMAERQRQNNYRGTFTYRNLSGIESFRLEHWRDDGNEYQRLYYLTGPEREAVMTRPLDCHPVGDRLIAGQLEGLTQHLTSLDKLYSFRVMGFERVAGRPATVLQIVPRDPFRFGYVFSIDRETGLLLKSLLVDDNQQLVEQFQFMELETGLDSSDFSADDHAKVSHRVAADELSGCREPQTGEPTDWQLNWVPEGFAFAGQQSVRDDTQMLMYTDGLSSFSVFLDPVSGNLAIEGRAKRGATNFYVEGVSLGGQRYQLTVLGEIPFTVAERVGQSIRPKAGAEAPEG